MTIEMVRLIFDYDKDAYRRMNAIIRYEVLKEYSKSNEKGIIFTGCFDFDKNLQKELIESRKWEELFEETYVIELEASLEERLRRNKTENRLEHKASKRDLEWSEQDLIESVTKHKLNSDPGQAEQLFKNYMKIRNDNIPPEQVANMIKENFNL